MLLLGAAGCGLVPGPAPTAPGGASIAWRACGNVECGTLTVPQDYADPRAGTLDLAVLRVPATAEPRLGALLVNPGGPGGSGTAFAGGFERDGLEQYDIVGWDPRGVGASPRVRCLDGAAADAFLALDSSPDDPAEREELLAGSRNFAAACLAETGAELLANVATEDVVRDLDALRAALGEERLTYYGASYGTAIGATYAALFGDRVGRMVLDAGVDPDAREEVPQAVGFDRALGRVADWCADVGAECALAGEGADAAARVSALLTRLDAAPLPVGDRVLTSSLAATGTITFLYSGRRGWAPLADAVAVAEAGDGTRLLAAADRLNSRNDDGSYGDLLGAFSAVSCVDRPRVSAAEADERWARVRQLAPIFGYQFGPDYTCVDWPVPARAASDTEVGDLPPVLVIGGRHDPATPYEWSEALAAKLQAALVTSNGDGHVAYGNSSCVTDVVRAYLVDGTVPVDGVECG